MASVRGIQTEMSTGTASCANASLERDEEYNPVGGPDAHTPP
jgi:hypothetical protein